MLQRSSDVAVSYRSDLLLFESPTAAGHLPKLRDSRTNSLTQVVAVRAEGHGPVQGSPPQVTSARPHSGRAGRHQDVATESVAVVLGNDQKLSFITGHISLVLERLAD